jgi:hypothetical protein
VAALFALVVCTAVLTGDAMCAGSEPARATAAKAGTATLRVFTRTLPARSPNLSQITAVPLRSGRPPRQNVSVAPARDRPEPPP